MDCSSLPTLLGIPLETRLSISDYLVKCTGVVSIFARYEITKEVDQRTIDFLHISQTICTEVQSAFYKNQTFDFRSLQAMRTFCNTTDPYHVSIVKNVQLGYSLCRLGLDTFRLEVCDLLQNHLVGVDHLMINEPNRSFFTKGADGQHQLNEKVIALRAATPKLATARIYYKSAAGDREVYWVSSNFAYGGALYPKLLFVPHDCQLAAEEVVKCVSSEGHRITEKVYNDLVQ